MVKNQSKVMLRFCAKFYDMEIKIRLLFFVATLFIVLENVSLFAQVTPIYFHSQYLNNPFLINPAIAGSKDFHSINLSSRQAVAGIAGKPRTQILSYQGRLKKYMKRNGHINRNRNEFSKIGLGGYIYHDVSGPLNKLGVQATYAYHLHLDKMELSHISFAISFSGFYYFIDYSDLNILRDPLFDKGTKNTFVPDANVGVYYYTKHFFGGLSALQLFETPIKWEDGSYESLPLKRKYFMLIGSRFIIIKNVLFEPSIMIHVNGNNYYEFYNHMDLNLKAYVSQFLLGVSYRIKEGISLWGEYEYQNYLFGLYYEFPFGEITSFNYGIIQVVLGFNFGLGKNRFGDRRYW